MDQVKKRMKSYCCASTKDKILTITIAFLFCISICVGQMIETIGYFDLKKIGNIIIALLLTPIVAILLYTFYEWLQTHEMPVTDSRTELTWKQRAGIFLFLMICWGIVLLGVFPGFFLYDAQDELNQVLTRIFTTHHPIFHVLYMGGIIQAGNKILGGYNAGICLLMLFQMCCFAAGFTYMVSVMRHIGVGLKYSIFTVFFLGLFPVIPMMVLCSSKDVIFSLAMVLWMTETYSWQRKGDKKIPYLWCIWTILLILLRNNAVYALLVLGVVLVILPQKGKRNLLMGLVASIVIAKLFSTGLEDVFHASSTEYQEVLTVPIQQLTRTYHLQPELFTADELETLYRYLPEEYLEKYEPKLSDGVKIGFRNEVFAKNKRDFLRLWATMGKKSPMSYMNAWLLTSYGYWYPDATIDVYKGHTVYTFTYGDSSYFGYETEQPGVRYSLLPMVDEIYRYISLENWKVKFPILYLLFSPGCMLWVQIIGIGFLWKRHGIEAILPYSCALFVIATLLLGPTFLPRYVFFLWPCNLFLIGDVKVGR